MEFIYFIIIISKFRFLIKNKAESKIWIWVGRRSSTNTKYIIYRKGMMCLPVAFNNVSKMYGTRQTFWVLPSLPFMFYFISFFFLLTMGMRWSIYYFMNDEILQRDHILVFCRHINNNNNTWCLLFNKGYLKAFR